MTNLDIVEPSDIKGSPSCVRYLDTLFVFPDEPSGRDDGFEVVDAAGHDGSQMLGEGGRRANPTKPA
jgi:hypothetical protein